MAAVGTTTLGLVLLSFALSILIWFLGAVYARFTQRWSGNARKTFSRILASSASSAFITLSALASIVVLTWGGFIVRTIYFDHMNFVRLHAGDLNAAMSFNLIWNFIDTMFQPPIQFLEYSSTCSKRSGLSGTQSVKSRAS